MNNKLLLLIIIIFLMIFTLGIFIFVINNKNQIIEKFDTTPMNYPRIKSNTNDAVGISISYYTKIEDIKTTENVINLSEKYDIIAESTANNLSINGYGTYYISSTFYINNPSQTNCISSLFNNTNAITLNSPKQNSNDNMISIIYPERFQFKGLEITIDTNAETILKDNITLYALFNNTPNRINTTSTFNGNTIKLNVEPRTSVIFDSTLYIVFRKNINKLTMTNIKILGMPLNYVENIPSTAANINVVDDKDITIFSNNDFEKLSYPITGIEYNTDDNNNNNIYPERTIQEKFNILLKNNRPPWGIYNAKYANNGFLPDLLNRECRKATISGKFDIKNDKIGENKNLSYLQGTTNTVINFPLGSLPQNYTVCVMTKYSNPNNNRRRILTASYNWLLGHWEYRSNGVMHNHNWKYYDYDNNGGNSSTDWVISCAKSTSTKTSYSIIINDVNKAFAYAGGNDNPSSTYLTINGVWNELSDFCFGYLFIWDVILSDSELLTVSQALTNYLKTGEEIFLPSTIKISTMDGKTKETAGDSAYAIKRETCTNENGIYWIKTPNGPPKQVYCIMDSECYGGGWMLAIKGSNSSGIFSYHGTAHAYNGYNTDKSINQQFKTINHWETNSVVRENDLDYNSGDDAKYDIFNYFKVSECLAIFDSKDTGGNTNNNYGWTWHEPNFYNKQLSLKDFFATSRSQFSYFSSGNYDFVAGYNNGRAEKEKYDASYITKYDKKSFNAYVIEKWYNNKIWSRQEEFQAFGFNIKPFNWEHKVRWGGTFNENAGGVPDTNDVSGGIGVSAYGWNAGNTPTCCESAPGAPLKQMGFKWFIR